MQESFETVNCDGLVPASVTVRDPVGNPPVLLTEKVCGGPVASMGVEAKPKLGGMTARAGVASVVVVVELVVLVVVVDDAWVVDVVGVVDDGLLVVVDVVAIVVEVVFVVVDVVGVVLVVGSVMGLLGHSPSIVGARSRNARSSLRAMWLSGPKSTW